MARQAGRARQVVEAAMVHPHRQLPLLLQGPQRTREAFCCPLWLAHLPTQDTAPCGIIPLENLDILEALPPASTIDRKTKVRFGLQHAAPNKIKAAKTVDGKLVEGRHNEYLFACETEDERNDWIRSLKANMQKKPAYFLMQQKKEKVTNRQQEGAAGVDDSDGE